MSALLNRATIVVVEANFFVRGFVVLAGVPRNRQTSLFSVFFNATTAAVQWLQSVILVFQ
ncbi:MAG: hypothetical protein AAFN78_12380 [Pseudomonadota bacterium]